MTKEEVRGQLLELADEKHRKFSSSLMPGVEKVLGVKIPFIRKIAKEIAKEGAEKYLENPAQGTFEENMLKGFIIGEMKGSFCAILPYIDQFVSEIDNWSVCDSFCVSLKITRKHDREMWEYIREKLRSNKPFELRFAIVMMLNYYITDEYIGEVLQLLGAVKHENYYVKMAVAWALSICYVKYEMLTHDYLHTCDLDDFTYNKAIQKIRESSRVDARIKESLKGMRRLKKN